jgi:hypothetical protein
LPSQPVYLSSSSSSRKGCSFLHRRFLVTFSAWFFSLIRPSSIHFNHSSNSRVHNSQLTVLDFCFVIKFLNESSSPNYRLLEYSNRKRYMYVCMCCELIGWNRVRSTANI